MGIEENKKVVKELVERMSDGDSSVIDELITENAVIHVLMGAGGTISKDVLKVTNDMAHVAFSDYHMEIDDMIGEGDKVMVRATRTSTHNGNFMGLAPTGNSVTVERFQLYRLENGKIAEIWGMDNLYGQYMQLGVLGNTQEIVKAYNESGQKKFGEGA